MRWGNMTWQWYSDKVLWQLRSSNHSDLPIKTAFVTFFGSAIYKLIQLKKKFWSTILCCWHLGDGEGVGKSSNSPETNNFFSCPSFDNSTVQHFQKNMYFPVDKKAHCGPIPWVGIWNVSKGDGNIFNSGGNGIQPNFPTSESEWDDVDCMKKNM